MKRCPQCGREYDVTMSYCLDDGSELLYGPASPLSDEPQTAILSDALAVSGRQTRAADAAGLNPTLLHPSVTTGDPDLRIESNQSTTNKALAMLGIALVILGSAFLGYRYFSTSAKRIDSIAVMPFVNQSDDANVDYLSDGMTETLIRSLSQIPGLNVKSRSSVFRYKGKETDAKTLGSDLGVQAVLNGNVVQHGDQLRVSLELINADNDNVIWTDTYDRKAGDLVSLQNDIARDVSNNLRLKLTNADKQKLAKNYTTDPEVYRLFLQGRYYRNKRTFSEVAKAVPYFKESVDRDPNFALGYVGLADTDEDVDRPQKKEYIRKALDIAPELAEAHASLGYQYMLDYDWAASERELKHSIELDPKYAQAYAWSGARAMMIGRYDEALAMIDQALAIDPASNGFNFYKGVCLGAAGRVDESIEQFKRGIALDPSFPWPHSHLSRIYRMKGDLAAAAEERAISLDLDGRPDLARGIRDAFTKGGWEAVQDYMRLQNPNGLSMMLTTHPKEEWIKQLTEQAQHGSFWLFLIRTDPIFDPLRGDPRFDGLVHKFDAPTR